MTSMPGPGSDTDAIRAWSLDAGVSPPPDPSAVPEGYMVTAMGDVRLHFLDWGGPPERAPRGAGGPVTPEDDADGSNPGQPGVLLLPGLLQPAWSWSPVARRLSGARHTVVADLRGQGLSDAPQGGYDVSTLAADGVAVAEGAGLLDEGRVVIAGHGFGGAIAAAAAALLGPRCAGVVLVDGGWERLEETTGDDVDDFLRGLDEPPEVLRTMDSYLADRRAFDPETWDVDQERAARDAVVETAAGHVLRAVRPHVIDALVRAMFDHDPAAALAAVGAPVAALLALGGGDPAVRSAELRRAAAARVRAGRGPIRAAALPEAHNLMRYRPAEVTAAILGVAD
jgi:pimeloyl-ACP methyl ester carboxylesterase